jgi:anaerobic magnesium-protoporphyrin IX monomethyl ester cyclase
MHVADVLLGQSYFLRYDPKLWRAMQPYAPLGTLYAAAYLRSRGHSVALFDAMLARSECEWAAALERVRPRIAVLYEDSFNYLSKMCLLRMRQAAVAMIDMAQRRGIPVLVAGSDATDHPDLYLAAGAAVVILGEGEATLGELVGAISAQEPLTEIAGIAYSRGGTVVRTPRRPFLRSLDALPMPAWDLIDIDCYRLAWRRRHGYHALNLATSRGCPYHCNWCAKPIYGQRYTVRSPEAVADEVAWLAREYQPDQLAVVDDLFGLQPGWIDAFATELDRRGAHVPFRCLMRADQIEASVVRALTAARCRMVWLGAESGSQRILDAMEKGVRVEQIQRAARQLHDAGISVGLFLQFGYPGETWHDIEQTLTLVREAAPDDIGISVSYPLPGTKFYERVRSELGAKQNWTDSSDLAAMYRATYPPQFYRALHRMVHHEFKQRQITRRMRDALNDPSGLRVADLKRVAAWAYHRAAAPVAALQLRRAAQ